MSADSCELCGKSIAHRELFNHLIIDHGWKRGVNASLAIKNKASIATNSLSDAENKLSPTLPKNTKN